MKQWGAKGNPTMFANCKQKTMHHSLIMILVFPTNHQHGYSRVTILAPCLLMHSKAIQGLAQDQPSHRGCSDRIHFNCTLGQSNLMIKQGVSTAYVYDVNHRNPSDMYQHFSSFDFSAIKRLQTEIPTSRMDTCNLEDKSLQQSVKFVPLYGN